MAKKEPKAAGKRGKTGEAKKPGSAQRCVRTDGGVRNPAARREGRTMVFERKRNHPRRRESKESNGSDQARACDGAERPATNDLASRRDYQSTRRKPTRGGLAIRFRS